MFCRNWDAFGRRLSRVRPGPAEGAIGVLAVAAIAVLGLLAVSSGATVRRRAGAQPRGLADTQGLHRADMQGLYFAGAQGLRAGQALHRAGTPRRSHGRHLTHKPHRVVAGLRAPALQSPAAGASLRAVPAFEWEAVGHALAYQFQLAADSKFTSLVETDLGRGALETHNTATTPGVALPDGVYWWRVRALTGKGSVGPWSAPRPFVKAWTSAPQLYGPDAATVDWPEAPLAFRWSAVPYAYNYILTIATDPGLANQVVGAAAKPIETHGTVFTPSVPLTPGAYFWAVTPLDVKGHRGTRSRIASFTYAWPTSTQTSLIDLEPKAGWPESHVFNPLFSWTPVGGAARYELEVSSSESFAPGSKWCCEHPTIGTSLAPEKVLANDSKYYWRVRAIDPRGNVGHWNEGPTFTKAFDDTTPSIPNLTVRDPSGTALGGVPPTDTPIVTWDPVPGASRYEVQAVPYQTGLGCDWTQAAANPSRYQAETASTAWTPLGGTATPRILPYGPYAQSVAQPLTAGGAEYCLRVLARSDDDAQGGQVVSTWTQINGTNKPAFKYENANTSTVSSPGEAYIQPAQGTVTPRTPLFTWRPVTGAHGYYVVIARDEDFTDIADIGYTNIPAYAPRLANEEPLKDQTVAYHWAILPAANANGSGVFTLPQENSPQTFNKASVAPMPIAPQPGAVVSSQPTFRWSSAENARSYELQVASDPSFGKPLEDITTDATAFTSASTYPANTTLYWRVRANDWNRVGLNWSAAQTFVRTLPAPVPSSGNLTEGEPIPLLGWSPVQGATGYEVHVDRTDGTTNDFSLTAPALTFTEWEGVGVWHWQVRADFPSAGAGQAATSGYSAPVQFVRTLGPPSGAQGVKTATRLLISWQPDPQAKQYEVDVSSTDGFSTTVDSQRTDNTSWAPPSLNLASAKDSGRLYWRVAAIDGRGNIGAFAMGSFGKPRRSPAIAAPCARHSAKAPHGRGKHSAKAPHGSGRRCARRQHGGRQHGSRQHSSRQHSSRQHSSRQHSGRHHGRQVGTHKRRHG